MATWTAVQVFGDVNAHHGTCCQCCDGYCPESDVKPAPAPPALYRVGHYLSDKYVAIKADLIAPDGIDSDLYGAPVEVPMPAAWTAPDAEPPASTDLFVPSRAARLTALGIDIRGDGKPSHLYLDGEHIGYLMPAERGRTLDEIAAFRRVVEEAEAEPRSNPGILIRGIAADPLDAVMVILYAADEIRAFLAREAS